MAYPASVDVFDSRETVDGTIQPSRVTQLQTSVEAMQTREVGAFGTVAIGALSAAATATVTITSARIASTSVILLSIMKGSTVAQTGAVATVVAATRAPGSGSCVVDVTNLGSAATLGTDYVLSYRVL